MLSDKISKGLVLSCLLLLLFISIAANKKCKTRPGTLPVSNKPFGDHCYYFSEFDENFFDANKSCTEKKGNLVSIHSAKENKFITDTFSKLHKDYKNKYLYIGLVHIKSLKPSNYWLDKTKLDFKNFDTNFSKTTFKETLICVVLNVKTGLWEKYRCLNYDDIIFSRLLYVCKF